MGGNIVKISGKFKAMLLVLALVFCSAGFAVGCEGKPATTTPPATEENGDNSGDNTGDNTGDNSGDNSGDEDGGEEQTGKAVYFMTGQSDYTVETKYYDKDETVTLPTDVPDKVIGNYSCPFLYWAYSSDDTQAPATVTMGEETLYFYAVYDNGMQSGDKDFELTADGYRPVDASSHGALNNLSLADGSVYSVDMTLPADSGDYAGDCGMTFAAGGYANNAFSDYLQIFVANATSANAGGLLLYSIGSKTQLLQTVYMSNLEGTAYYAKFRNWLLSDEEETFTYSVRLDKSAQTYYIGVDGEEIATIAVDGTKVTSAHLDQSIVGFRAKSTNVYFANPQVKTVGSYFVTFDANGGTIDGATEKTVALDTYDYDELTEPTRTGYTFKGWYRYDEGSGEALAEDSFATKMSLNATYLAKWEKDDSAKYTLAIETQVSGYTVEAIADYQLNESVVLPKLSHAVYDFASGYYYDAACTSAVDFANIDTSKINDSTLTVYAKPVFKLNGAGTESSPYAISTVKELYAFAEIIGAGVETDKYYQLQADIDLNGFGWTPIAAGFTGTFDGNNKTISSFNVSANTSKSGFFSQLDGGTVKDLTLGSVSITSTAGNVGALAGNVAGSVTISNVTVSGTVKGLTSVGGIVGYIGTTETVTIKNCTNGAAVTATSTTATDTCVGGIAASAINQNKVTISGCVNNGAIKSTYGNYVGGIIGLMRAGSGALTGCTNNGNITAAATSLYIGGIAGCARVTVTNCYCLNTVKFIIQTYTGETVSSTKTTLASALDAIAKESPYMGYLAGTNTNAAQSDGGLKS